MVVTVSQEKRDLREPRPTGRVTPVTVVTISFFLRNQRTPSLPLFPGRRSGTNRDPVTTVTRPVFEETRCHYQG